MFVTDSFLQSYDDLVILGTQIAVLKNLILWYWYCVNSKVYAELDCSVER